MNNSKNWIKLFGITRKAILGLLMASAFAGTSVKHQCFSLQIVRDNDEISPNYRIMGDTYLGLKYGLQTIGIQHDFSALSAGAAGDFFSKKRLVKIQAFIFC